MLTGKEILEWRKSVGMTAKELGRRLGVTENTVLRWEHEIRFPSRRHMNAIHALKAVVAQPA